MKEKKYESVLEDTDEKRTIKTQDGKELVIEYHHRPNVVGKRSIHTGLPIWIGHTKAEANGKELKFAEAEAKCWTNEVYDYNQARVVVTGRILKKLNLPTELAEQARE